MEILNHSLEKVMNWMRANKRKLNPDKMEVLLVGYSSVPDCNCTSMVNAIALIPKAPIHSLGVLSRAAA